MNILINLTDLVSNFLYYDRKEDDTLKVGDIEKAILNGEITLDEIVNKFKSEIEKSIYGK